MTRTVLEKELKLWKRLIHENIQRLYSYTKDEENIYCLLEYVPGIPLLKRIKVKHFFTEQSAFTLFAQICSVLHFLHSNGYLHRDIRPDKMIVVDDRLIKMADFEFCTKQGEDLYLIYMIYNRFIERRCAGP